MRSVQHFGSLLFYKSKGRKTEKEGELSHLLPYYQEREIRQNGDDPSHKKNRHRRRINRDEPKKRKDSRHTRRKRIREDQFNRYLALNDPSRFSPSPRFDVCDMIVGHVFTSSKVLPREP